MNWWGGHGKSFGPKHGRYGLRWEGVKRPWQNFGIFHYKCCADDILTFSDREYVTPSSARWIISIHFSLFLMRAEKDNRLTFLDIFLTRYLNGMRERSIYRKTTWSRHYLQLFRFAPAVYERGLVLPIFRGVTKICTSINYKKKNNS